MWVRVVTLGLTLCLAASAQSLTVSQMISFVKSSVDLGHKDKEIAKYLQRVKLTERLGPGVIETLQSEGAGPRTVAALRDLREASSRLPDPKIAARKKRAAVPPPSPEEQERIINAVRDYALNYTKGLPDFLCTRIDKRFADPSGMEFWHKMDTVVSKLTYFEQKEEYKVILVNNRPVTLTMDEVGGATTTGVFGTMMNEIFDPLTDAAFQWERWGKLRGRICHVYSYYVRQERSQWTISYEKVQRTTPAYQGLIYVDRDTEMVTRIKLEAINIEPSFPVQAADTVLDYDLVDISGGKFMVPLKFEMRMRQGKLLTKNETEFRMYKKYGTESIIKFDLPEDLPEAMFVEEPPAEQ